MLPFQLLPPCLRDAHPSLSFLLASLCFQHVPRSLHTSHLEGASLFFSYQLLAASLHSLFVPFFSLGNCCLYLLSPKKKYIYIYMRTILWWGLRPWELGHAKLVVSFSSSSLGCGICLWHWRTGSQYPGDVRSEIRPLFPQVTLWGVSQQLPGPGHRAISI